MRPDYEMRLPKIASLFRRCYAAGVLSAALFLHTKNAPTENRQGVNLRGTT